MKLLKEFTAFINERYSIHLKRKAGKPAPWTKDPILAKFRFCNVQRNDDRVTKWLFDNWLAPNRGYVDIWFACYVARVFNQPRTLGAIGWPLPWNAVRAKRAIEKLRYMVADGDRIFNAAYIVSTNGVKTDKLTYYATIFDKLWADRKLITPQTHTSLAEFHARLMRYNGLGSFMAAQVVADAKYYDDVLYHAIDFSTWAAPGPGSLRGMSWVEFGDLSTSYTARSWRESMDELRPRVLPKLHKDLAAMTAQDLQNSCCEWDKYCRTKYGNGKPKQLFKASKDVY